MYNPYCPECGAKNDPQSVSGMCINCGMPLEEAESAVVDSNICPFCPRCGYKNDVSVSGGVCSKCGASLEEFKEEHFDSEVPDTTFSGEDAFSGQVESSPITYKYTYRHGQEPIKVELIAPPPPPGTRPKPLKQSKVRADVVPPSKYSAPRDYQKPTTSYTPQRDRYADENAGRMRQYDSKKYNFRSYDRKEKKLFPFLTLAAILLIIGFILYLLIAGPGMLSRHNFEKGKKEYKEGKYDSAIKSFKNASFLEKKNPELYYYLGSSYYHQKNYDEAITYLNRAKSLDKNNKFNASITPELSNAYYQRALLKAENNKPVEAASDFEFAFQLNPELSSESYYEMLYRVGLQCHEKGDDKKAVMLFTKAIQAKKEPKFYLGRAVSLSALGKTGEAIEDLKAFRSTSPDMDKKTKKSYREIVDNIIKSAKKRTVRQIDASISELEQADTFFKHNNSKIHKALVKAYIDRGEYHNSRRNFTRARYDLTRAAKMDPTNARALYLRGNVYKREKNYNYALRDYREAQKLDPGGEFGEKAKQQEKIVKRIARYSTSASSSSSSTSGSFSKAGKQQYYIYGGTSSGYVVKPHKGTMFVISGSHYLSTKKWYWGKRSGNTLTIYSEYGYGKYKNYRTYTYTIQTLQKLTVSSMSTTRKSSSYRSSSSRYRYSTPVTTYILYTRDGNTLFIDDSYADRYLKGVRSCYGVVKLNKVDLYLGKDFRKRSFSIKGSGRVY